MFEFFFLERGSYLSILLRDARLALDISREVR